MTSGTEWLLTCLRKLEPSIDVHYFDSIPSTNSYLKEYVPALGYPDLLVIASEQSKGRGRFDRNWFSPVGGLYFSLGYIADDYLDSFPLHGIVMSNNIAQVLGSLGIQVQIKWPNDIMIEGKKVGGILSEVLVGNFHYSIIGVGINLNFNKETLPQYLHETATTIMEYANQQFGIEKLICSIVCGFVENIRSLKRSNDTHTVLDTWKRYNCTLGKSVLIETRNKTVKGRATAITDDGFLIIQTYDGELITIQAGDVIHLSNF